MICLSHLSRDGNEAKEGFRNMYVAILRNCQAHVISATLAHYIVTHGSRFRFSHQFAYIPIAQYASYFNKAVLMTIVSQNTNGFEFGSSIINYLKRPIELRDECNLSFFIDYKNARLSAALKKSEEYYAYIDNHPAINTQCVIDRQDAERFIPELPFCLIPDLAKVGIIMDFRSEPMSIAHHLIRERYAMYVCLLLFPFRCIQDIQCGKQMLCLYIYIIVIIIHIYRH